MGICLCTQIKDRLSTLKQVIGSWLVCGADKIVIVDIGSSEPIEEFLKPYIQKFNGFVEYFKVDGDNIYNRSVSKNIAIRHSSEPFIFYVDADIKIKTLYFKSFYFDKYWKNQLFTVFWAGRGSHNKIDNTFGCHLLHRSQFDYINGYNERLSGYGYEDADFFSRLIKAGYKMLPLYSGLNHVDHEDSLRTQFHEEKNMELSTLKNRVIAKSRGWR